MSGIDVHTSSKTKITVAKIAAISGITGAIAGAVANLSVGVFGYWNKDRELDIELIRISLGILAGEYNPSEQGETNEQARRFAIRALVTASDVKMSETEIEQWVISGPLPFDKDFTMPAYGIVNGPSYPDINDISLEAFSNFRRPINPEQGCIEREDLGFRICGEVIRNEPHDRICINTVSGELCGVRVTN